MFTGIIEAVGKVDRIIHGSKQTLFVIQAPFKKLKIGSSLAVNGVCLTVIGQQRNFYSFNLLNETTKRSSLASLKKGSAVNLERPLKMGSRIEGHFVLGHVDGVGKIIKVTGPGPVHEKSRPDQVRRKEVRAKEKSFLIQYPAKLKKFILEKGSIAIDGTSLTIGKVTPTGFWIHCVPHTLTSTIARFYQRNTQVNLEADALIKYLVA